MTTWVDTLLIFQIRIHSTCLWLLVGRGGLRLDLDAHLRLAQLDEWRTIVSVNRVRPAVSRDQVLEDASHLVAVRPIEHANGNHGAAARVANGQQVAQLSVLGAPPMFELYFPGVV